MIEVTITAMDESGYIQMASQFLEIASEEPINFQKIDFAPWIYEIESKASSKFPHSFNGLYHNFSFPSFTCFPIEFPGNGNSNDPDDIENLILADDMVLKLTLQHGYLQFAKYADGSNDPVCFRIGETKKRREYEIVRIALDGILDYDRIQVLEEMATSLFDFIQHKIYDQ